MGKDLRFWQNTEVQVCVAATDQEVLQGTSPKSDIAANQVADNEAQKIILQTWLLETIRKKLTLLQECNNLHRKYSEVFEQIKIETSPSEIVRLSGLADKTLAELKAAERGIADWKKKVDRKKDISDPDMNLIFTVNEMIMGVEKDLLGLAANDQERSSILLRYGYNEDGTITNEISKLTRDMSP